MFVIAAHVCSLGRTLHSPSPGLGELGVVSPRAPGCGIKPQGFAELFVFGDHGARVGSSMTSLSWFEILSR